MTMTGRSASLSPKGRYDSLPLTLMPPRRQAAPGLPELLKDEAPTVKVVWLWLEPRGVVSYSQRAMAEALGLEVSAFNVALVRLRALGLVEDLERSPRTRGKLRAVRDDT